MYRVFWGLANECNTASSLTQRWPLSGYAAHTINCFIFFTKNLFLHSIHHFLTPVVSALVKCTSEVIQAVMLIDVLSFALPKHGGGTVVTVSVWSATKGVIAKIPDLTKCEHCSNCIYQHNDPLKTSSRDMKNHQNKTFNPFSAGPTLAVRIDKIDSRAERVKYL